MTPTTRRGGRPVTAYVTAQVVGVLFALGVGWALLGARVPVWGTAACWLVISGHLSRKRLPTEALGTALQIGAVLAVFAPMAGYLPAAVDGADLDAVAVARDLFGPALLLVVAAGFSYAGSLLLKRRTERKLSRRGRKAVYRSG